jgi:hypothetical protein
MFCCRYSISAINGNKVEDGQFVVEKQRLDESGQPVIDKERLSVLSYLEQEENYPVSNFILFAIF